MFSKAEPDAGVAGREKYRALRPECSGLKIRRPELDPASFRSLVECFGANGSIPEIRSLVASASEADLRRSVDLLNATFLADPETRADSRGTVRSLKRKGRWDGALAGFAPAFAEPERMRALIRLISVGNRAPLVVKTVERFDPGETRAGFEMIARLAKSRAFAELSRKVRADPLSGAERDRLLEILADFFRRPTPYRSANLLLEDMSAGKSAPIWTYAFGEGAGILDATSRFGLLLRDLAGPDGLRRLARMHRGFHHPIACWGEGKVFPDPWRNLSNELSAHAAAGDAGLLAFVGRFAPLTALAIPGVCELPEEFPEHYPAIMRFTAGRTGGAYLGLLSRVFAGGFGVSSGYFVGEWGEPLAETLAMLAAKPWFGDLLLLVGELDSEDRDRFARWTRALLRDRKEWTATASGWEKTDFDPVFAAIGEVFGAAPADLGAMLDAIGELFGASRAHPWFAGWKRIVAESESNGLRSLVESPAFSRTVLALGRMAEDGRLGAVLGDVIELFAGGEGTNETVESEPGIRKDARHAFAGADLREIETRAPMDDSLLACAALDLRKAPRDQWVVYRACVAGGGVDADAFAGIRVAQDWALADGGEPRSFLDSFVRSWVALPVTTAEKREMIALLTGKAAGLPAITPDAVRDSIAWVRARIGTGRTRIFALLNRFQTELKLSLPIWRDFFGKVGLAIDDERFAPLFRAVGAMVDPATLGDRGIGPAPNPPAGEAAAWVRELECERDPVRADARAAEIGREFREGVLGWERPDGKIPLRWDAERLKPRLRALAESLGPELRAGLYAWIGSLDPKEAARWFADRAADPRWVAVLDPETRELRVRWMTSLDRLESILVNSNFTYLLRENYGLKFIAKFAEAWGDEPRSRWPREIQERYSGRRAPPTLAEAYEEVVSFVGWFEKFGGMPEIPDCVAKDGPIAKIAVEGGRASAPDLVIPFSVKAKAFNLKQTLSVIRENLPGAAGPGADGMRFLRDLFWAVHASAPRADRDPSAPERNPLRFLQKLGDLGGLRSISRGLQTIAFASERVALEDAFGGLKIAVAEPAFDRVLDKTLADPSALEASVEAAVRSDGFRIANLTTTALARLALDRSLRASPALIRWVDSILGNGTPFPRALFADSVAFAGASSSSENSRLRTWRASDVGDRKLLSGFGDYLAARVLAAIRVFPAADAIRLLDRDPSLRSEAFAELRRWSSGTVRQSAGEPADARKPDPFVDLFLSPDRPAFRRAVGLWCGTSAGRYAFELAARPDESLLMIDGLLRSGQSAAFADFLEALLRELAD